MLTVTKWQENLIAITKNLKNMAELMITTAATYYWKINFLCRRTFAVVVATVSKRRFQVNCKTIKNIHLGSQSQNWWALELYYFRGIQGRGWTACLLQHYTCEVHHRDPCWDRFQDHLLGHLSHHLLKTAINSIMKMQQ